MAHDSYDTSQAGDDTGPSFNEFPATSYEQWRQAVEKMLKGAPFEKKLVTKTYEGIDLQPLYRQEDVENLPHIGSLPGFAPFVRGTEPLGYKLKPWDVCQELRYSTAEEFNKALRADMERGQTAVNLVLDEASRAGSDADRAAAGTVGRAGVSISTGEDLDTALSGVDLTKMPFLIQAGAQALPVTALLVARLRQKGTPAESLQGCIGADPLGTLVEDGKLPISLKNAYDSMAKVTAWAAEHTPGLQTVLVSGQPYHNGGASAVQELAFVLAAAVEYIRQLQDRGLTIDTIAPRMRFTFSIGSNFFMEIARMRAARVLWAQIVQAFGGDETAQKMTVHARTSTWNKTAFDPYVNMLRTTVEAFAGAVGGCDSLHVGPFDEIVRTPDEFSRRIARNTHTVLREEAHLARTIDPVGGSWYVESLTDAVAKQSWALFQDVEKQGGLYPALQAGFPQSQIAEVAKQRAADAARRKTVFVGVNMYANLKETPLEKPEVDSEALQVHRAAQLTQYRMGVDADWHQSAMAKLAQNDKYSMEDAIQAASGGATLGDIGQALGAGAEGETVTPIANQRGSEAFEALRNAAEAFIASTGARPKVFLANMGPLRQHKARADFSRGFLEVGGFDVVGDRGFDTPQAAAQAALESGAPVVVICSTDDTYPELVPPLVQAIKQTKPETAVLLAGRPADQVEAHRQAGVDDFIFMGANCYDLLLNLQKKIGVIA
ncbi:MAG: methylmalonyl-CoA mutase family protein [Candidatus Competibacteraceae bacterium]|jgi:methylmalonyl-CoA mutase|nr:methylmalonyl-CoA mutase family protein [Candidatus Competibacteraceae bacterium]